MKDVPVKLEAVPVDDWGFAVSIGVDGMSLKARYDYVPVWVDGRLEKVRLMEVEEKSGRLVVSGWVERDYGRWEVSDVVRVDGDTVVIDRTWRYRGKRLPSVRLGFELEVPSRKEPDYWMIPYISVNGNKRSRSVPVGMEYVYLNDDSELPGGRCAREPWMFREERTTAPGFVSMEFRGVVVGMYTEPAREEIFISSCGIEPTERGYVLRNVFPFYEAPLTFVGAAFPGDASHEKQGMYSAPWRRQSGFLVEGKAVFKRRYFVVMGKARWSRHGYVRVWESAWRRIGDETAKLPAAVDELEERMWESIEHFHLKKKGVEGYVLRIDRDGDPYEGFSPVFNAGWCGPTMMLGYLGLWYAVRCGRIDLACGPVRAVDFFVKNTPPESRLFPTCFDVRRMEWVEGLEDAVQLGGGAYWLLRAVDLAEEADNLPRSWKNKWSSWKQTALGFCELALERQMENGALPAYWLPEGVVAEDPRWAPGRRDDPLGYFSGRTMGIHVARAFLQAYRATSDERFLNAACRAGDFYGHIVRAEEGYGDCTDILFSTTENDGAWVPEFYLELYDATGEQRYLDYAVRSAEYTLAFMYTYNVLFPPETECGRRGMRTRGMSAISPETAFVCWWFCLQANAYLKLWRCTGEERWKEYAKAAFTSSLQMMSEPGDTFGLAPHLLWIRAEVIPVLDTIKGPHIWKQGMTGYTWHQPVWWPAAFNLLNIAFMKDNFPGVLQEMEEERTAP